MRAATSGKMIDENGKISNIIDTVTGLPRVIRTDHAYIHAGQAYGVEWEMSDFANDETRYFSFKTPEEDYIHFKNVLAIDCKVGVYESISTIDDTNATELSIYNRNRTSSNTSNCTVKLLDTTPTTSDGDLVKTYQGEYTPDTEEVILKRNHEYVIAVTNISGAQANVLFEALFYEESDG